MTSIGITIGPPEPIPTWAVVNLTYALEARVIRYEYTHTTAVGELLDHYERVMTDPADPSFQAEEFMIELARPASTRFDARQPQPDYSAHLEREIARYINTLLPTILAVEAAHQKGCPVGTV